MLDNLPAHRVARIRTTELDCWGPALWVLALATVALRVAGAGEAPEAVTPRRPELVLQLGHTSGIRGVAFSPDGKLLATAAGDVKVWDARTGLLLRNLPRTHTVQDVAFSPDGRMFAGSTSGEGSRPLLIFWRTSDWTVTRRVPAGSLSRVLFSPDGTRVTLALPNGDIGLLTLNGPATAPVELPGSRWLVPERFLAGGRLLTAAESADGSASPAAPGKARPKWVTFDYSGHRGVRPFEHTPAGSLSPDGKLVVTIDNTGVRLRRAADGAGVWKRSFPPMGDAAPVAGAGAVAFSPDGRSVLFGNDSNEGGAGWEVWDVKTGRPRPSLRGADSVGCARFSPRGDQLAVAGDSAGSALRVVDVRTGRSMWEAGRIEDPVTSLGFSPDGKTLAVGHGWCSCAGGGSITAGTVYLWELGAGRLARTLTAGADHHLNCIYDLAFSPDGRRLAGVGGECGGCLATWNPDDGKLLEFRDAGERFLDAVGFSSSGRGILTGCQRLNDEDPDDATRVRLWDAAGKKSTPLASRATLLAVSPDGRSLVVGGSGVTATVRGAEGGSESRPLAGHRGRVTCARFSRDGTLLATGCRDRVVRVWEAASGKLRAAFSGGHLVPVTHVAFSPDGTTLASVGTTVKLWSLKTGKLLRTLGVSGPLAFSPDGAVLAVGSAPEEVTLWDPATGRLRATLTTLSGGAEKPARYEWVASTPDGYYSASAGMERRLRWRMGGEAMPTAQPAAQFRRPEKVAAALAPRE